MIHVQITILDATDGGRPKPLADFVIVNDGTGDSEHGNYQIRRSDTRTIYSVVNHPRGRGWLPLVQAALKKGQKA